MAEANENAERETGTDTDTDTDTHAEAEKGTEIGELVALRYRGPAVLVDNVGSVSDIETQ